MPHTEVLPSGDCWNNSKLALPAKSSVLLLIGSFSVLTRPISALAASGRKGGKFPVLRYLMYLKGQKDRPKILNF